ncbi:MAG: isoprenyl transferase [Candidatus Sedimenticola sp. 6PFRAG5]
MIKFSRLPRHIAIIMDGNGRWAQNRGKPRYAGHKAGVNAVRTSVEQCAIHGVEVLTLFAFSSENWNRPKKEVGLLMELFMAALKKEVKRLNRNNVRLRIIGDRTAFSSQLQEKILQAEAATSSNTGLILQIAANYGGRWDVATAVRKIAEKVKSGETEPADIDEDVISAELSFSDLPDPDLFIRTGGEQRISNFMLWQSAYTELYFADELWPDFGVDAFESALASFQNRQRRFGMTGEQVDGKSTDNNNP